MDTIRPTNDLLFRKLCGSPEFEDVHRGMFQDFFGISPKEIIITNPYSISDYKDILENGNAVLRETISDVAYKLKLDGADDRSAEGLAELQVRKFLFYE